MLKFTESQLEKAIIDLVEQEGYTHLNGDNISRNDDEVLIEACLLYTSDAADE